MSTNPFPIPAPSAPPEDYFRFDGWERLKTFGIVDRIGTDVTRDIIDELNVIHGDAVEKINDQAKLDALDEIEDFKLKIGEQMDKLVENLKLVDDAAREIADVLA